MRSASEIPPSERRSEPITRRTISIALVVLVHLLAILLGYLMSPPILVKKRDDDVQNYPLMNVFDRLLAPKPKPRGHDKTMRKALTTAPKAPTIPADTPVAPLKMMVVSSDVFAASDISKIKSSAAAAAPGGPNGRDAQGSGEGPGGAPLYNAQWYREPTQAEMSTYMPKNAQSGWGEVMCKTFPDFHVEDCRELAEYPQGSGFARAVRQAAWQFKIRPPRQGGQPIVGAWVRIHYELTIGFRK